MKYLVIMSLCLSGCLAHRLKAEVEDHAVRASTYADWCRDGTYLGEPCPEDLQHDLDANKAEAECLMAITKRQLCQPENDGG